MNDPTSGFQSNIKMYFLQLQRYQMQLFIQYDIAIYNTFAWKTTSDEIFFKLLFLRRKKPEVKSFLSYCSGCRPSTFIKLRTGTIN